MSIRNILVAYNGTQTSKAALKLASILAHQHDAYVTGLFAETIPTYQTQIEPYLDATMIEILVERATSHTRDVEASFEAECRALDLTERVRFLSEIASPDVAHAEFARTYDLAVVGQPDPDRGQDHKQAHPDLLALQSGRPVLVVPRDFDKATLGSHALLAWDGKRAASRALADAMGLLEAQPKVTVLHVAETDAQIRKPGRDIMEHLSRHDIAAELVLRPRAGRSIASIIEEVSGTSGAGLLVMGAYEHSRFSEMLLGGVTRSVLAETRVPVLISH